MDIDNINTLKNIKPYNGYEIAKEFIEYFYLSWSAINFNNLQNITTNNLLLTGIINQNTKLNYNCNIYKGDKIIELLYSFKNVEFNNLKYEILDSDSRQIYILVKGNLVINEVIKEFCQSFLLIYTGEKNINKWSLINSLLLF
jgi:hypothetical protein